MGKVSEIIKIQSIGEQSEKDLNLKKESSGFFRDMKNQVLIMKVQDPSRRSVTHWQAIITELKVPFEGKDRASEFFANKKDAVAFAQVILKKHK